MSILIYSYCLEYTFKNKTLFEIDTFKARVGQRQTENCASQAKIQSILVKAGILQTFLNFLSCDGKLSKLMDKRI